jgi:hypothetical protein
VVSLSNHGNAGDSLAATIAEASGFRKAAR